MSGEKVNTFTSGFPAFKALGNVLLPQEVAGSSRDEGRGVLSPQQHTREPRAGMLNSHNPLRPPD